MLDACAPGYTAKAKKHRWWVTFQRRTYRGLPLGEHGHRRDPEIETGHVRNMSRFFAIIDCAKEQIEQLR